MDVLLIATINLLLQVVIIAILTASFYFKRTKNLFFHGSLMTIAVILNAFSFFLVMGPSLLNRISLFAGYTFIRSMLIIGHASLGSIAEVLGVWIVISWRFQSPSESCVLKKRIMRITSLVWAAALILGLLSFADLYLSSL